MDYTTDDIPAGLKIVEQPPGRFAWTLQREVKGRPLQIEGGDGFGSWEEAMAAGRKAIAATSPPGAEALPGQD